MSRQLLVFDVAGAGYGIETSAVQEIVPAGVMTRLPGAPRHVAGLLNLRGTLVTVVDLARRLAGASSEAAQAAERSTIIVQSGGRLLGLLVDDVHDVQTIEEEGMTAPGDAHGGVVGELGHLGGRVVLLIDVQELVRQTLA